MSDDVTIKTWPWRGQWLARATRQWLSCVAGGGSKAEAIAAARWGVVGSSNALDFEGELVRMSAREVGYEVVATVRKRTDVRGCKHGAHGPHHCPYAQEIGNDDRLCTCCEGCQRECAAEI